MTNQTNLNLTLDFLEIDPYFNSTDYYPNITLQIIYDNNTEDSDDLKIKEEFLREFLICSDTFGAKQFSITRRQIFILKLFICLSIIGLMLTLAVYSIVPRLRNVPGKSLMSLSVAKIAANLCFLSSHLVYNSRYQYWGCRVIAILRHYFILTMFLWTAVIAFDCYRTFRGSKSLIHVNSIRGSSFVRYSLFCWSIPSLFISKYTYIFGPKLLIYNINFRITNHKSH